MSWASAIRKTTPRVKPAASVQTAFAPTIVPADIDWDRLVSLDFETYYDTDYTLSKLSTSEYVRDERFEALMVAIKIGRKKTKLIPGNKIKAELAKINWTTHSLLCHNVQFDGFILSHHYGIIPKKYHCTMSMARGLHSNEIGAGLDEVSVFYEGHGKIEGGVEDMKGIRFKELFANKPLWKRSSEYCVNDVDEMFRIFSAMHPLFPASEMELVHMTARMFCAPVLKLNIPRVQAEYEREIAHREELMLSLLDTSQYYNDKTVLKKTAERALEGKERDMLIVKRIVGSNEKYKQLLIDAGLPENCIPRKVSPAYIKKSLAEKILVADEDKWSYAFAKDDLDFISLPDKVFEIRPDLDPNDSGCVLKAAALSARWQQLIDVRIAVKSTTNITRAERFLRAGANGWSLPVGYAYARAHTLRWGGNNKMNMQNLKRGGELRLAIEAAPGHQISVVDSGQIEARVNGWLWEQHDLLDAFRVADKWDKSKSVARGLNRDAYCRFGDSVYGREITTDDKMERFVGKVCIAEGELVLTHRGLVPINRISLEDRLWDGVEWVRHDGLIDQGIQEVITYDGLTATPDHEVFTECGRVLPLWQAASEMARLQRTGAEGRGLRFCDDHVVADTPRKRLSVRQGTMRADWYYQADVSQQLEERQNDLVPEERQTPDTPCGSAGSAVRRDPGTMQQPDPQTLGELRWPGNQMSIRDQDGIHPVGVYKPATQGLQGCGDRPEEQRRELRAGELEASDAQGEHPEPTQYSEDHVAGAVDTLGCVPQPSIQDQHWTPGQAGTDRRADTGTRAGERAQQTQELALHRRQARVYDIANAGPRRRFTTSNVLILNCVLGLGYQMGAPKFQITLAKGALGGPPVYFSIEECHRIVNLYRRQNYKIAEGWKTCAGWIEHMANPNALPIYYKCLEIGHEYIRLPNGLTLKYPELKKATGEKGWDEWSYRSGDIRKKIYGGLLCENLVQALARIIVAEQMLMIDKKYQVVMTTHDECVTHPKTKDAQKCYEFMYKCMTTPLPWCPDIPLAAEGGWAANYSK